MSGLFEDIVLFDEGHRIAGRQAAAVAQKRIEDRIGNYLKLASSTEEYDARLDFVSDDIRQIVADVAEEYEADVDRLQDAIDNHLKGDGVTDLNEDLEDAPSAIGEKTLSSKEAGGHKDGCTCGFCKNKGNLPGQVDQKEQEDKDASEPSEDDEEGVEKDASITAAMKEALTAQDFTMLADAVAKAPGDPHALAQHFADYLGTTNPRFDRDRFIAAATGHPASGRDQFQGEVPITTEPQMPMPTAATHVADADRDGGGAVTRESLPTGNGETIGEGPSPKMDKKRWKPNALNEKGNLPPIDTEASDSPVPTTQQDIGEPADHTKDFLEQTNNVMEEQSLPTADETGQSKERNISQDGQDGQWTESENDPVTSEVLSSTNPLEAILESGFATDSQVESALHEFNDSAGS